MSYRRVVSKRVSPVKGSVPESRTIYDETRKQAEFRDRPFHKRWTTKGTMNAFAIIIIAAGLVLNVAGQSATTNAAGAARLQLYVRTYQTDTNSFFSSLRAQMRA